MKSLIKSFLLKFSKYLYRIFLESKFINKRDGVVDLLSHEAKIQSKEYFEEYLDKILLFYTRKSFWTYNLDNLIKEGVVLEFGVFKGHSINFMSNTLKDKLFFGFDSFEGLQENWKGSGLAKNHFSLRGKLPKVNDNVNLISGWFSSTLPQFLKNFNDQICLIHIDCDTYESSKEVLSMLKDYIDKGTVIIFDEYFGYPGWKTGEYKALQEFIIEQNINYKYLAISNQGCCSIQII